MTHSYIPQPGGPGAYEQQVAARCRRLEQDRTTLETELGQARKRNAELQQRAEQAEAALAALHEGEEPHEDERTVPTPAQWIWWWNRATPAERLDRAGRVLADVDHVYQCFLLKWEERAREAEARVRELQARLDEVNDRQQAAPEISVQVDGEWKPVGHLLKAELPALTARYLSYPRPACADCDRAVHAPLDCDQAVTLAMSLDHYFTAQIKAMRDEGQP
jgi:DNA repair exonuclease SbcCD ATPase subunit